MSTYASQVGELLVGLGTGLSGGHVHTYSAGTTNAKATYKDKDKAEEAANPVVLDSNGRAQVYGDGWYKFVIHYADESTYDTWDNLQYGKWEPDEDRSVTSKTANYTLLSTDDVCYVDATADNIVITLPDTSGLTENKRYMVKKTDSSAHTVTVDGNGTQTIDGATTFALMYQYDTIEVIKNGNNWSTVNSKYNFKTTGDSTVIPVTGTDDYLSDTFIHDWNKTEIENIKFDCDDAANIINIKAYSADTAPTAAAPIRIKIPDGETAVLRSRTASYLSGTSMITLADAAGYWGKSSADASAYKGFVYAIWDGTGIVWALGGRSDLTNVSTTTTATDTDYLLLETSSTYTRNAAHFCISVAEFVYEYDTDDTPNYTVDADSFRLAWGGREPPDASISQVKLKTSTGEVSTTSTTKYEPTFNKFEIETLPGGEYGFYPQIKKGSTGDYAYAHLGKTYSQSYVTVIGLEGYDPLGAQTPCYAQQRYVTSSGEVYWIFMLQEKATGKIVSSYSAPDHPCFGNGGKPLVTPHPFGNYDTEKYDLIVINPTDEEIEEIHKRAINEKEDEPDRSFLQVILEDYEPHESGKEKWPDKAVTVGLPKTKDWTRERDGTPVKPIKKVIPKPANAKLMSLRRKKCQLNTYPSASHIPT